MPGEQRRRQIYELIREDGGARVSVLSNAFDVSEPTIRSDLEKLERDGMVVRDHGGAYLCGVDTLARAQNPQPTENADKKRLIA